MIGMLWRELCEAAPDATSGLDLPPQEISRGKALAVIAMWLLFVLLVLVLLTPVGVIIVMLIADLVR